MIDENDGLFQVGLLMGYPIFFLLTPVFLYFGIDQEEFVILCSLMILDSVLGGVKSHVLSKVYKNYDHWMFKKFWWGLSVKILVAIVPFLLAVLANTFDYNGKWLVTACIKIMVVSEAYSVIGNIYSIKNKNPIKKVDAISLLLHSLRSGMYQWIINSIKKVEKSKNCEFHDDK